MEVDDIGAFGLHGTDQGILAPAENDAIVIRGVQCLMGINRPGIGQVDTIGQMTRRP